MTPRHLRSHHGQSLTEYTIIGASVVICSLGGLFLLGNSVSKAFEGMLPGYSKPPTSALPVANGAPAKPGEIAVATPPGKPITSSTGGALTGKGLSVTTADGTVIEIPDYPKDVSKSIVTMGANGTTDVLASTIELTAVRLFATGEISQSQYNTLISLANQGHYLGKLAGALENAGMKTSGGDFNNVLVTVDGAQMSVIDVAQLIGMRGTDYDLAPPTNALSVDAYPGLQKFNDLYQQAKQSGALSDPAINAIVSAAASNIANINVALDYAGEKLASETIKPGGITSQIASLVSHQNAGTICKSGNGQDTGISCN